MNLCRECRHWHKESEHVRKHRDAKLISHGFCDLTGGNHYEPDDKKSLAYCATEHASGFSAFLSCDEDFGCVQWEAREEC